MKFGYEGDVSDQRPEGRSPTTTGSSTASTTAWRTSSRCRGSPSIPRPGPRSHSVYAQEQWTFGPADAAGRRSVTTAPGAASRATGGSRAVHPGGDRAAGGGRREGLQRHQPARGRGLRPLRQRQDVDQSATSAATCEAASNARPLHRHESARRASSTSTHRSWTDANGNFVPDCNLLNPAPRTCAPSGGDFCGAWSNLTSARRCPAPSTTRRSSKAGACGRSTGSWACRCSSEVLPRTSVEVGYSPPVVRQLRRDRQPARHPGRLRPLQRDRASRFATAWRRRLRRRRSLEHHGRQVRPDAELRDLGRAISASRSSTGRAWT